MWGCESERMDACKKEEKHNPPRDWILFTDEAGTPCSPPWWYQRVIPPHSPTLTMDLLAISEGSDSNQQRSFQETASGEALERYFTSLHLASSRFKKTARLKEAMDLLATSEGSDSGQQHSFQAQETASGDAPDHFFDVMPLCEPHSLLHSGSSSPVNFENSAVPSGSNHLVSHRGSPPLSLEGVRLGTDAFTDAPGARAVGSVDGCRSTGPDWPGWDTADLYRHLDRKAQMHKQAAALNAASCLWLGCLPRRHYDNPVYSHKVFLGGVPRDITEANLLNTFSVFGQLKADWPEKEDKWPYCPPQGFVYLLFDCENSVKRLLEACTQLSYHEFFYKLSSWQIHNKEVQVVPWVISNSNFIHSPCERICYRNAVFVGALHKTLTAEDLAHIMEELFGSVLYAGLDTDLHQYPKGSGRVIFETYSSYLKAVDAAIVLVKTNRFTKKIQIDPYLEDTNCQICNHQPGKFFCRAQVCFRYFCGPCWHWQHCVEGLSSHQPLMRKK